MIEVRPLVDSNLGDAEDVVRSRFDEQAVAILHREMKNPLRRICDEVGDVAYEDGRPVCFQACILRRLFFGRDEVIGRVGGLTCIRPDASVEALVDVRSAARKPRANSVLGFGNSQNRETAFLATKASKKVSLPAPDSCSRFLWTPVRAWLCAYYFVRRKIFRCSVPRWKDFSVLGINFKRKVNDYEVRRVSARFEEFFDEFQSRYLKNNEGLVSSRSSDEMMWMFGERILKGHAAVLAAFKCELPVGYIVIDGHGTGRRWMISDMIALHNHREVFDVLLYAAKKFLRQKTPAMMIETTGFPSFVQETIMRHLPHMRLVGFNQFSWGSKTEWFRSRVLPLVDTDKIWFFGPYDGDLCM